MKNRTPHGRLTVAIGISAAFFLCAAALSAAPIVVSAEATKLTFAIVAQEQGAAGTFYKTDMRLLNPSDTSADVLLEYTNMAVWEYGEAPRHTRTFTLAAGEEKVLDDFLLHTFGLIWPSSGPLQLFSSNRMVAVARIYNDQRTQGEGTLSQFVAGVPYDAENPGGAKTTHGVLPALSDSPPGGGSYRTNIGMFNDGPLEMSVSFSAFDVRGNLVSTGKLSAPSGEIAGSSAASLFPNLGVRENFYVTYVSDSPDLYVYASVVDNANGDAIYIPARATAGALHHTFPVVARVSGASSTSYRTDMKIVNSSDKSSTVLLEFYQGGGSGNVSPSATRIMTVAPGEERVLDDVLVSQFNIEKGSGAIRMSATQPVIAVARIYNDQRANNKGTFGQFVDGANDFVATRADRNGVLPALSHSAGAYRTNIGWFNGGPADSGSTVDTNLTLRAFDSSGALLVTSTVAVPAYSQKQQSAAALFPGLGEREHFYVTYSTDVATPLYVYASVIDNVNGDAIYIPAQ